MIVETRIVCWKKNDKRMMMVTGLRVLRYWKMEMIVLPRMLTERKLKSLRLENNQTLVMMVVTTIVYWKKNDKRMMMTKWLRVLSYWKL